LTLIGKQILPSSYSCWS